MAKCAECGYLTMRNRETRELVDAEDSYRTTGRGPLGGVEGGRLVGIYDDVPICFVRAANLREEFSSAHGTGANPVEVVICRERPCKSATPRIQGFTPKEHKQMISDAELERLRTDEARKNHRWNLANFIAIVVLVPLVNFLLWFWQQRLTSQPQTSPPAAPVSSASNPAKAP